MRPSLVRAVDIRSGDARQAVWVRASERSFLGRVGAAGVRAMLAVDDGRLALVRAEQAGARSRS